jgi:hypothetical protein
MRQGRRRTTETVMPARSQTAPDQVPQATRFAVIFA